ncbi:hypothetical protein CWO89_39255, partial [Bradyrhizobium sp. Leo170]
MQSNGKSETFLEPPTASEDADCLLDAWREALAHALDQERRQWLRERELIEAKAEAIIATLKAEVAVLQERITIRLAELTNGADGAPGPAGPPGEKGEQGERGEQGQRGEAG